MYRKSHWTSRLAPVLVAFLLALSPCTVAVAGTGPVGGSPGVSVGWLGQVLGWLGIDWTEETAPEPLAGEPAVPLDSQTAETSDEEEDRGPEFDPNGG